MFRAPIVLTERQEKWLAKHFKHTKNEIIAEKLGVSLRSVPRLARKRGLTKSKQFVKKCQTAAKEAAYASNLANGTFPPKGFAIPGREKYQFQKGESLVARIGAKKNEERKLKSVASRNATIRREKARIVFGLPQKTNLRLVRQDRKKCYFRNALRKKCYVVDETNRIVMWNDDTIRSKRMEGREQPWYKFMAAAQ